MNATADPQARNRRNSGREGRGATIQLRVSEREKHALHLMARKAGETLSSYIRKLAYPERP